MRLKCSGAIIVCMRVCVLHHHDPSQGGGAEEEQDADTAAVAVLVCEKIMAAELAPNGEEERERRLQIEIEMQTQRERGDEVAQLATSGRIQNHETVMDKTISPVPLSCGSLSLSLFLARPASSACWPGPLWAIVSEGRILASGTLTEASLVVTEAGRQKLARPRGVLSCRKCTVGEWRCVVASSSLVLSLRLSSLWVSG